MLKHSNPQNPNFTSGNLEMYMLDIGQGDAFVFLQNDKVLLVDTGNIYDWNATNKALKELGVKKIDYLIITHPHQDHIGGLFSVCMNYKIDELITQNINPQDVPGREVTFHIYNFAIKLANFAYGGSLVTLARENKIYRDFSFADSMVEFLGPEDETYEIFNNYGVATQTEAQAGSSNAKYMTPLRTKDLLVALGVQSAGNMKIVVSNSQPSVISGTTQIWINTSS